MNKLLGIERARGFFRCRNWRGMIAASIYDDLSRKESKSLQTHLGQCPACQKQADALRLIVKRIPVDTPTLDQDLWPAIRRAARKSNEPRYSGMRLRWTTGAAVAVCALVAAGLIYTSKNTLTPDAAPVAVSTKSPLEDDMAAVAEMIENRDYVAAYRRIEIALRANPDEPLAGEAMIQLADLAYSHLNWYPEAYEAYDRLFRDHPSLFNARTDCIWRRDLLDEARAYDYAPLYALDAALRAGDASFARLESVVARYPSTLMASRAAAEMARQSLEDGVPEAGESLIAAMECARNRCTNPVAIARLKLELGHLYVRELRDTAKARGFYSEVAKFDDKSLATLAEGSLAALDSSLPAAE